MSDQRPLEVLVGLHVHDDESYARYRAGMTPLLHSVGGSFRYDFRVGEVLAGDEQPPINRLFVISFPDEETKDAFFSSPDYLAVRAEHFDGAVSTIARIASWVRED